ncbi:MAG: peptidoglycan glycosyltransferase [Bacteroidetes bacterium]|nr:MAG: peptidoglycan glycosyltransferase [Bacteroidota bacterium]
MGVKKDILVRVGFVYILMLLFALVIVGRLGYLQTIEKSKWDKANTLTMKDITIEANRGDICAEDGRLLASSVPYYEIRMDLKSEAITNTIFNNNVDSLAYCLSRLFADKTKSEYKRELISARFRGERYHLIKRKVNYKQLKKLKKFPLFRLGRYRGGFIYSQENKRIQPFVNLASRTIGYLNKGESGTIVGIEGAYDRDLKGVNGVKLMQKISSNVWMPIKDGDEVEAQDGKDIITTIDINIQDVAQNALLNQLKKHDAGHGCVVLMEVKTGEIKAIANLTKDKFGNFREEYNYAIGESTEPGSTFKLSSLIVALEDGYVDLEDSVDTDGGIVKYHGFPVRDSKKGGHGKLTVKEAFEVSSNVGISKIITKYYSNNEKKFVKRLYSMHLNEITGIEILGEGKPYIKYPGDTLWSGISLPQMSIGYEIRLTPLQILTFYNAVANDGVMVKPKLVKAIKYHGDITKTFDVEVLNHSICSKSTIKKAKKMLEGVVDHGTARNLKNNNYKIAGKTGTAQIANKKYGYKYQSKVSYQASFVGYFPADNPKYSCIVVVNAPSNDVYYGNLVAGPVFKEISDKVYSTDINLHSDMNSSFLADNIPYSKSGSWKDLVRVCSELAIPVSQNNINSDWVVTTKTNESVLCQNRLIKNLLVPNVKGMGVKDALFILENIGLKVVVEGSGLVKEQSIPPGTRIRKGKEIILKLI